MLIPRPSQTYEVDSPKPIKQHPIKKSTFLPPFVQLSAVRSSKDRWQWRDLLFVAVVGALNAACFELLSDLLKALPGRKTNHQNISNS